jgi:hypothetical protein
LRFSMMVLKAAFANNGSDVQEPASSTVDRLEK